LLSGNQSAVQRRSRAEGRGLPANRSSKTDIERGRPEVRRQPLDGGDGDVAEANERLKAIDHLQAGLAFTQDRCDARELQFDGRERLAEFIMQLACERCAFLLPSRMNAGGELAELGL